MSESIDTLRPSAKEMRVNLVKGDLLIGGKSFIDIVFVSLLSQGTGTNATATSVKGLNTPTKILHPCIDTFSKRYDHYTLTSPHPAL
jgi:hypothetical protein